ncbi:MAG: hypothetical protein ACYS8X_09240 [Planctomycetota bacterium]
MVVFETCPPDDSDIFILPAASAGGIRLHRQWGGIASFTFLARLVLANA